MTTTAFVDDFGTIYPVYGYETEETASTVYVMTENGDEITTVSVPEFTQELLDQLQAKHGTVSARYQGGSLDGHTAW